jgi:primosomal protein N' (replication factor Y)
MTTLFPQLAPSSPPTDGPFAAVALERGIDRTLDYRIPPALAADLQIGQRVRVPLGRKNRPARGYVVGIHAEAGHPQIKDILAIEDARLLLSAKMLELACWMSRYYVTPLGMVIQSVIPSAVKKKTGMGHNKMVRLAKPRAELQEILEKTKAPKRRAILARLLLLEDAQTIELRRLASEAGATAATVKKLAKLKWIAITEEPDLPGLTAGLRQGKADEADIPLNEDQQKVFDELVSRQDGGFSVNLLHGVTGSGKTEVYLQCIRRVIAGGKQALVLVPEIALTPQTVRRFEARFARVAILHSGLGASDRHRYWQQISAGAADVVVGARSAVFAPLPKLGIIVVDEEHDSSYKQDSAPRYHGRDVAIKRGQIENVPVILGSATPSLESYFRAKSAEAKRAAAGAPSNAPPSAESSSVPPPQSSVLGPQSYFLLSLPRRVRGLSMPAVELVDLRAEAKMRKGMHLIGLRMENLLRQTIAEKHQAILLLNRRGYSNFVYCASCNEVVQCAYCDATLTYHRWGGPPVGSGATDKAIHSGSLHCHYCLAVSPLPEKCAACGKKLSLFGLGTQRVEEELNKKFPGLSYARVDGDTMRSGKDYEELLGRFGRGEIQVMLGTQMIAKGLDYPNVTLVGVISGDTALALPDFRAGERTFQLITQVAGRAGRGDGPGRVVLQTFLPDDPAIGYALRQDFTGFAQGELARRREVGLPPFTRMARIILRGQDAPALHKHADQLAADLSMAIGTVGPDQVKLKGPMPCPINRIAGYWRDQIVLFSNKPQALQRVLALVRPTGRLTKAERVAVDVDPVALL